MNQNERTSLPWGPRALERILLCFDMIIGTLASVLSSLLLLSHYKNNASGGYSQSTRKGRDEEGQKFINIETYSI